MGNINKTDHLETRCMEEDSVFSLLLFDPIYAFLIFYHCCLCELCHNC